MTHAVLLLGRDGKSLTLVGNMAWDVHLHRRPGNEKLGFLGVLVPKSDALKPSKRFGSRAISGGMTRLRRDTGGVESPGPGTSIGRLRLAFMISSPTGTQGPDLRASTGSGCLKTT